MTESLALSSAPESPGKARRFVSAWLNEWGYPELVDNATLVTSELATNAVEHTGEAFTIALEDLGDGIHIEVKDSDHTAPVPRHPTRLEASGRGMQIIDTLSDEWGTTLVPDDGKLVWCDLHEHSDAAEVNSA